MSRKAFNLSLPCMYVKALDLPLHTGKAPYWLFSRMRRLAGIIAEWLIEEKGERFFLERLANPMWFQAFALVLGFDWHSSGTTTTAIAALREGYKGDTIRIYGGKGKLSREALSLEDSEGEELIKQARLAHSFFGKAIDDGYNLYFASLVKAGKDFVVIDQGMNEARGYARRYHWHASFEPYSGDENIAGYIHVEGEVLNTASPLTSSLRHTMVDLARDGNIVKEWNVLRAELKRDKRQRTLDAYLSSNPSQRLQGSLLSSASSPFPPSSSTLATPALPKRHYILLEDLSKRDIGILKALYEYQPKTYDEVLLFEGFGPKKVRALALMALLLYGEEVDWRDPVKFSYAHGGKDGIPYPVDRKLYDENIALLEEALEEGKARGKLKESEAGRAMKSLLNYIRRVEESKEGVKKRDRKGRG